MQDAAPFPLRHDASRAGGGLPSLDALRPSGALYEAIAAPASARQAPPEVRGLLGLEADEDAPGSWWRCVFGEDLQGACSEYGQAVAAGHALDIEYRVRLPDGQEHWLRDRLQVVARDASGRTTQLIGVVDDVTSRNSLRRRAQDAADKYRSLFDSIESGFCVLQMLFDAGDAPSDYVFLEVNRAFTRVTGISDAVGRRMREIAVDHEAHWFETYGRIARTGQAERFEHEARELGFYYDVYAFPVGEPGQDQVGVLFTDITKRKQAEDGVREDARRKTEFIAMLAHELRNPLATITSGLQAMKLGSHGVALHPATPMMERQIGQMTELLDDLLDINRITLGKVVLRRERRDLVRLLREVAEAFAPHFLQRGLLLECVLPSAPVWALVDATRMSQVLGNLLNNAAKFSPEGGRVRLSLEAGGDDALIQVRDEGLGMEARHLDAIFELFAQVDSGRHATFGGLGVGMALARELMHMQDGGISAASEGIGRGSTFTVSLPLDRTPQAAAPATAHQTHAAGQALSLVVIDDNRDAADSISLVFQALGHQVRTCYDGAAGLAAVRQQRPDVVFTDIGMPEMDGHIVCRALRAGQDGGALRIVALTGWGAEEDRLQTAASGFDHHLVKPVTAAKLREALAAVMALHR